MDLVKPNHYIIVKFLTEESKTPKGLVIVCTVCLLLDTSLEEAVWMGKEVGQR